MTLQFQYKQPVRETFVVSTSQISTYCFVGQKQPNVVSVSGTIAKFGTKNYITFYSAVKHDTKVLDFDAFMVN